MSVSSRRKNESRAESWDYNCARTKKHQIVGKPKNHPNPATTRLPGPEPHPATACFLDPEAWISTNTLKTKSALMKTLAAPKVPSKLTFSNEKGDIEVKLETEICIVQGLVPWVPGYAPANCDDVSETLCEQLGVYNCHHNCLTGHANWASIIVIITA